MRDQAGAEEARRAMHGPVDELLDHHEVPGRQILLERADRRDRQDVGHARALERIDIGAEIELGRRDGMTAAMARQEDEIDRADPPEQQLVRRRAPGRIDAAPLGIFQPIDRIEPRSADDPDRPTVAHMISSGQANRSSPLGDHSGRCSA